MRSVYHAIAWLSSGKFGGPTRIRTEISLLKRQDSSALELSTLRAIIIAVKRLKSHNNSDWWVGPESNRRLSA
jgi:hypothetical protein